MFLKRLSLNGFKSFCDYSEITFVKGISAIIGPNGCGKSNIVDAIKWVVGEQKTKMLRANNMTDIIFKGTENRKGIGRAEVKLTLINENNILPIDFNEVEISRIIYSNGENEYYINKKRVRLKDIQELFYDTGIGKSAYSVMEQGKIDMILSNKPEDRRYIIEEAAGITKYRVKRIEAASRLGKVEENIVRIKDIIDEVKSQFNHVKNQAKKAEEFKLYHDKEIELEIRLNLNKINKQKVIKEDLLKKTEKSNKELNTLKEKLNHLEGSIEEKISSLNVFENQKIDSQREVFKIQSDIKIQNSRIEILNEQAQQHEIAIKNDSEKIILFENNIKGVNDELKDIENKRNEYDEKVVSITKDIKFYNENISALEKQITESEELILNHKKVIIDLNTELENKREEQKKATNDLIVKFDQSPDIFDINDEEILNFKNNLNEDIVYILKHLPDKRAFIDDIIRGGYITKESDKFLNLLKGLRDELVKVEEKVLKIDKETKIYIQKTEKFLVDIFGPEGLLSQKRSIEHRINELVDSINEYNGKIDELQLDILKTRNKKDELNKILYELNLNFTTIKEKKNSIDNEVKRLLAIKAHHESSKDELFQKTLYYKNKIDEIKKEIQDIESKIIKLNNNKESIEKKLLEIDNKIKNENIKMTDQQKFIKDINSNWINKKGEVEKINIKITEANTTISNIYDSFYENFSIDLKSFENKEEYKIGKSYDEIREELADIKLKKHSLGSVNLMAIEESKDLEERYNLLIEQLQDLEAAKKDIYEMIGKINKVSEEMFLKTFKEIKGSFHKIFRKLFNGGNAEISLTDPENILETGIEIMAHPPGQKTQSITLLSGGQRSLTAIALMFAAYFVRPSPFCLLDEIDAALDEQNIRRFVSLLNENKENSQFIIITHNNYTISTSDVMYGVTQEEEGVSKIVSARFIKKDK